MTVELMQTLSLAAYIAAGVLFLLAVALFFLLDVPKLYGDISGRTAKKAIEAIRQQNESSENKAYQPRDSANAQRSKLTDKITKSGNLQSRTAGLPLGVGTEKLAAEPSAPQSNEVASLDATVHETTLLESTGNETAPFESAGNETTVLGNAWPVESGETTVLVQEESYVAPIPAAIAFSMDVELSFTGSSEIIE